MVQFYLGAGRDARGRSIDEIWQFGDDDLESLHDYIQWLFPTRKASAFNPAAPRLSDGEAAAFRSSPDLRDRVRRSLRLMLRFYGLELGAGSPAIAAIRPAADLAERGPRWWGSGNHNHLRLTRILDSLAALGLESEAQDLNRCLEQVRRDYQTGISERTLRYWADAAHGAT